MTRPVANFPEEIDFLPVAAKAEEVAFQHQPWPGQFRLRASEFNILADHWRPAPSDSLLEVGCGNGFGGMLLAKYLRQAVVTDLYHPDRRTHSIGLGDAPKLRDALGLSNVQVLSCSGDRLPFADSSFDVVLSLYVMEHLKDRPAAFADMARVLKPGGRAIVFVPSWMERIYRLPGFHLYLASRVLARMLPRRSEEGELDFGRLGSKKPLTRVRFRETYPHFPLPPPHGEYTNSFEEFRAHRFSRWLALAKNSGLECVDRFTTVLLPRSLIGSFVDATRLYPTYSRFVDRPLGGLPVVRSLGESVCLICEKRR